MAVAVVDGERKEETTHSVVHQELTVEVLLVTVLHLLAALMLSFNSLIFILSIFPLISLMKTLPSFPMNQLLMFLSKVFHHLPPFNTHTLLFFTCILHTHGHGCVLNTPCNIINCFNNRCCLLVNYAGAEAPRNSLDGTNFMEPATLSSSSSSYLKKDETTLHIEVTLDKVPPVNLLLCSLSCAF